MDSSGDIARAVALVRQLIETRTFKKERLEDADVRHALAVLGRNAASGDTAATRLGAVSLLGKAAEVSKPIAIAVRVILLEALRAELPPPGDWGAAEDRFYLAKAVASVSAVWVPDYAAKALATSEISEKLSRDLWAELAIGRAASLAEALTVIGRASAEWVAGRQDRVEAGYRKLARICEALTQVLLVADVPSGEGFGKAFLSLVALGRGGQGSEIARVREEAAAAVLELVTQTLRLRFDLVFDSDIYRSVGTVRGWWRPARPPEKIERLTDRIGLLAMQALHILARQNVQDLELRRALQSALGAERVNKAGSKLATADPSLNPTASHWLATGQTLVENSSGAGVKVLAERELDEILGRLIISAEDPDGARDVVFNVADVIDLFEPEHATTLRRAGDRIGLLHQWIKAAAAHRGLGSFGQRGQLIAYDPAVHDAAELIRRGSEVRITIPAVVRSRDGQPASVVLKAVVEQN